MRTSRGLSTAALVALLALPPAATGQTYLTDVGFTALRARLGAAAPTGAGVAMTQVEASEVRGSPVPYAPNPGTFMATRSGFGITYETGPTPPTTFSSHANRVGNLFYGDGSMATGVTAVRAWEFGDFLSRGLRFNTSQAPDLGSVSKVSNHSYAGSFGAAADDDQALRRLDYLVARADHVLTVAVGSGAGAPTGPPAPLVGSTYNGLTVGLTSGNHFGGLTTAGGAGRVKPDLVTPSPDGSTSLATPIAGAAAALMVETAGADQLAAKPQTVKAVLMAGATKAEFAGRPDGAWTNTQARPLDLRFGAGELNVDNSHRILSAGRQPAGSAPVGLAGWDFDAAGGTPKQYFFDVPANVRVDSLSVILAWNREFADGSVDPLQLSDLNLSVFRQDAGGPALVERSISAVDTVEHVWLPTDLAAGRYYYQVDLAGGPGASYALAWQVQVTPVPEPATAVLAAAAGVGGLRLLRRRAARA